MKIKLDKYQNVLSRMDLTNYSGKVSKIIGLTIESTGPEVKIGELCKIIGKGGLPILSEVVGFRDGGVLLMPLGNMQGLGPGSTVTASGEILRVGVGDHLQGRILDGLGKPMDGRSLTVNNFYPVMNDAPNPLKGRELRNL